MGLQKVAEMAVRLGLRGYSLDAGQVDPAFANAGTDYTQQVVAQKIVSFTLGVSPVSPLELANVGATLNSDGRWCPPTPIDTITDRDGKFVTWDKTPCDQAVPAELARTLAVTMEGDLVGDGTAAAAASAAGWKLDRCRQDRYHPGIQVVGLPRLHPGDEHLGHRVGFRAEAAVDLPRTRSGPARPTRR